MSWCIPKSARAALFAFRLVAAGFPTLASAQKYVQTNWPTGNTLTILGLWGLAFGTGGASDPTNTLLFTAGPDHEAHGLFGTITALP